MDFLKIAKLFAQDFYSVPDYQRDYEWTNAQNSTLADDIFSLVKNASGSSHFLGAIVTIPYEESNGVNKSIDFANYSIVGSNVKHVVDGQQRLTSFSLFIKAIIDLLSDDDDVDDDTFRNNYVDMLKPLVRGTAYNNNGQPAPRLILNSNTEHCYNKEILGVREDSYKKNYKGAKRLIAAHKLFKNEITNKKNEFIADGVCTSTKAYYKNIIDACFMQVAIFFCYLGSSRSYKSICHNCLYFSSLNFIFSFFCICKLAQLLISCLSALISSKVSSIAFSSSSLFIDSQPKV